LQCIKVSGSAYSAKTSSRRAKASNASRTPSSTFPRTSLFGSSGGSCSK
jgi:hypothetical protein